MSRLLLDLGNTRLKWALHDGDDMLARGAVAWNESVADALSEAWSPLPRPAAVFGASVVDGAREQLVARSVATEYVREVNWLRTPAEACGMRNAYARLIVRLRRPGTLRGGSNNELAILASQPEALFIQIGDLCAKNGAYDDALRAYELAAARRPENFDYAAKIVRTLTAAGRRDAARLEPRRQRGRRGRLAEPERVRRDPGHQRMDPHREPDDRVMERGRGLPGGQLAGAGA